MSTADNHKRSLRSVLIIVSMAMCACGLAFAGVSSGETGVLELEVCYYAFSLDSTRVYPLWRLDETYASQFEFEAQVRLHFALKDRQLVFDRVEKDVENLGEGLFIVGRVAGRDAITRELLVTLDLAIHEGRKTQSLQYDENFTKLITVELSMGDQGGLEYQRIRSIRTAERTQVMWK